MSNYAETISSDLSGLGRSHLKNLSTHLIKMHGLSSEKREPFLKQAQMSSWQASYTRLHLRMPKTQRKACKAK